jgi:IS66 Orf2 like protein
MLDLPKFKKAYLYQRPINVRWGENKFVLLYEQERGVKLQTGEALLFFNAKRYCLKLFFRDALGSSELQKIMPRGDFLLPAPIAGPTFVEIIPSLVQRLFSR